MPTGEERRDGAELGGLGTGRRGVRRRTAGLVGAPAFAVAAVRVVSGHLPVSGGVPAAGSAASLSDAALACASPADDGFAAVAPYIAELPGLVRFLRRTFPHLAADAEDIAQDALVAVRGRIAHVDNPVAYLYAAAKKRAYTVWKRHSRVVLTNDGPYDELRVYAASDPAPEATRTVDFDAFLKTLPRQEQRVAVCQYVYAMTAPEIAKALNVKEGTVKSWQNRIRNRARQMYGEEKVVSA